MPCYQCGAAEGSDVKLCPSCTKARLAEREKLNKYEEHVEEAGNPFTENLLDRPWALALLLAVLIGISSYFMLFSVYGPGFGLSKADMVYNKCVHKISAEMKSQPPEGGADIAASEVGKTFMQGMTETICQALKEECKKNPDGESCQALSSAI